MLGFVSELSIEQFSSLVQRQWVRNISAVHIHHTWRPRASQWRGKATVDAMRRVHMQSIGWSDIAQHLTIGPDGSLWSGRHLDRSPASAVGHNGSAQDGPFMIELVGDFDRGQESFDGLQAQSTYRVVAGICRANGLLAKDIRFHREFTSQKTCPGSSIDLADFRAQVDALLTVSAKARHLKPQGGSRYLQNSVPALDSSRAVQPESGELRYDESARRSWESVTGSRGLFSADFSAENIAFFNKHVVNTSAGRLSTTGCYTNSIQTIIDLVGNIVQYVKESTSVPRIVLYAHGGLVSEETSLKKLVLTYGQWWLDNGVYPVFFVWETGLLETFKTDQPTDASRGFADRLIEVTIGSTVGRQAWDRMKINAAACSAPQHEGPREPGGAFAFCSLLSQALGKLKKPVELHAVGHSAGSIFHCHMLPMLDEQLRAEKAVRGSEASVKTLSLLAPACRVDLFDAKVKPMVVAKKIENFALFTMHARAELDDHVAGIYRKSLLYLVRNACESGQPPILGLEESIRSDAQLSSFLSTANAQLLLSPTQVKIGREASQSLSHGGFDNDSATMNAVLRRVLALPDSQELAQAMVPADEPAPAEPFSNAERSLRPLARASNGTVHALCIGIDNYPVQPLAGCVADARLWADTFTAMGAKVHTLLLNEEATKRNIVDAWRRVSALATAGDTLIIQYAGHGTQARDLNGDETDMLDEAWVPIDGMNGNVLLDDEIGGLIDAHTPNGVQVVVFSDSCHSGSTSRAKSAGTGKARFISLVNNPAFVRAYEAAAPQWAKEIRARSGGDLLGQEILYSGCQDHELSFEENGHGKFTLAAVAALRAGTSGGVADTYRLLADRIALQFGPSATQRPNFTASKERGNLVLFGTQGRSGTPETSQEQRLSAIEAQLAEIKTLLADIR